MQLEMHLVHIKNLHENLFIYLLVKMISLCKWVYKMKVTNNKSKLKYTKKLVLKGYKQKRGSRSDLDGLISNTGLKRKELKTSDFENKKPSGGRIEIPLYS